jgi:3-oxoacyl-[acyl-carrier protein] reductase
MTTHATSQALDLSGRRAIVTGGGRGLGRVMALALVGAGADVVITGARSLDELERTAAEAEAMGKGRCVSVRADVSDSEDCARALEEAQAAIGSIDTVVNNAARGAAEQPGWVPGQGRPRFWEVDPEVYARMVATNVCGPFYMARLCAPAMIAAGWGRIVNISTSRPTMIMPHAAAYGLSKAALETATRVWARELDGTGVTVNVLLPGGASDTALIPGAVGERSNGYRAGKGPLGREGFVEGGLLPPEIMAPPLLWLASSASDGVTGRRFVARDWDPDPAPGEAALQAEAIRTDWPHII